MPNPEQLLKDIEGRAKEIHTDAYPMSIGELMSIYRDGDLDIHPEFQRFFRWTDLQRSKFIESILLGIPIPSLFVSQREDGVWDVVDGVQRLSTIFEFTGVLRDRDGDVRPPSTLVGTPYLPHLEGMRWQAQDVPDSAFPESLQRDFKRQKVDLKIIKKESDENAKYDLFERLNTLGSTLSDQEVRNCLLVMLNPGFYTWLQDTASNSDFQTTIRLSDKSLEERYDLELLLRFILLSRASTDALQGVKDVDEYLTTGMRQIATDPGFDQTQEATIVATTFKLLNEALGDDAFTRQDGGRGRGGFLISMFEVIATGLGYRIRQAPQDLPPAAKVKEIAISVAQTEEFRRYSRSGTSASSRMPRLVPLGRTLFGAE
jgi:hypothetical protein